MMIEKHPALGILGALIFCFTVIVLARESTPAKDFPLVKQLFQSQQKLALKARMSTLDYSLPDFKKLPAILADPQKHTSDLPAYINYYERVNQALPDISESYGILGVLYYYNGQKDKAVVSMLKAYDLNPQFFWNAYNLSLMYWENSNFIEAIKYAKVAIGLPVQESLKTIYTSKIYRQFINSKQEILIGSLKNAYQNIYVVMASSLKSLGYSQEALKLLSQKNISEESLNKQGFILKVY